jgi:CBS domain-containing protein
MKVREILGKNPVTVITISPNQSLLEASQLLAKHNIGAVVVVDKDDTPIGILSERDIVRQLATFNAETLNHKVHDIMTKDVIIALPDDDLSYVSSTMTDKRIRHLPIMDKQKLVGIISIGDVVKMQLDHFANEAHMLRQYITGG